MIYLFTVAAPAGSGTSWYSQLFTIDHSHCFDQLSELLEPSPSAFAIEEWLDAQLSDHEFEEAQRRLLLQGFPQYFARLWERAFFGQYVVGNADPLATRAAPGLWLLWPSMKFLFSYRDGIATVDEVYRDSAGRPDWLRASLQTRYDTADDFEQCCHRWRESVDSLMRHKAWLAERGAQLAETRLERITSEENELRDVWNWLVGGWEQYRERNVALIRPEPPLASSLSIWDQWSPAQQAAFTEVCGEHHAALGYPLPS